MSADRLDNHLTDLLHTIKGTPIEERLEEKIKRVHEITEKLDEAKHKHSILEMKLNRVPLLIRKLFGA